MLPTQCHASTESATDMDAGQSLEAPKIWLHYDQAALDDAYDQSKYAPNQAAIKDRRVLMSRIARARLGPAETISYGPTPIETFDLYRAPGSNRPLVVYVHGGAWRNGSAKEFAFLAEVFVDAGISFAALDFVQIDDCAGDLLTMIGQVQRATAQIATTALDLGADPERLHLVGHSSGSHLASCLLTTDWQGDFGLPRTLFRGALLCSGMYDLAPVRLSARSRYVAFHDAMEHELSAMRHLDRIACPVILAHGTLESPEFIRQTRDLEAALDAAGKPVELIVAEGYNHFEILETLATPYGLLGHAMLKQIGPTRDGA